MWCVWCRVHFASGGVHFWLIRVRWKDIGDGGVSLGELGVLCIWGLGVFWLVTAVSDLPYDYEVSADRSSWCLWQKQKTFGFVAWAPPRPL